MQHVLRGKNMALASGALVTGTTSTLTTTVTIPYTIDGKFYSRTALTNSAAPTTDVNTGLVFPTITANKGACVVYGLDSSGNVKCAQGDIKDLDASGNFMQAPDFPAVPDSITPFAYQIIKAGSTAGSIVLGSSSWNATGYTNAIVNVAVLPSRPQVS